MSKTREPGAGTDPVWRSGAGAASVAVIVALDIEARTLDRLPRSERERVRVAGPGRERAAAAARAAISEGARALVSWGLAGGLRGDLGCGAVVLPARILDDSGEWPTDAAWRRHLAAVIGRHFNVCEDAVYSAGQVIESARAKSALATRTGAAAVDMESAAIAETAASAGLPCVAIRVVADEPGDALPAGVDRLVSADGRTRLAGLLGLARSPVDFGRLIRLAQRSLKARRVLRQLAISLTETRP